MKCTIFVKRDFHLFVGQTRILCCFGQIPFCCEQHFHRLSGFWSHTRNTLEFLCKGTFCAQSFLKNPTDQKFWGIFFRPFLELKVIFGQGVSIRKRVFIKVITTQLKHCHELIHGITVHDTFLTFVGVKEELTGHGIHDTPGQVLVLHGVRLITCLLYGDQSTVSTYSLTANTEVRPTES